MAKLCPIFFQVNQYWGSIKGKLIRAAGWRPTALIQFEFWLLSLDANCLRNSLQSKSVRQPVMAGYANYVSPSTGEIKKRSWKYRFNSFVREKIENINGICDQSMEINVTLKLSASNTRENKICEITCLISGKQLFTEKRSATFKDAIIEALEICKKQIIEKFKTVSRS